MPLTDPDKQSDQTPGADAGDSSSDILQKRLEYLEEKFRWALNLADMVSELGREKIGFGADSGVETLFNNASGHIDSFIHPTVSGFMLVDQKSLEFQLVWISADEGLRPLTAEVDAAIAGGQFGIALNGGQTQRIPALAPHHVLILNPVATKSRTLGMYLALIDPQQHQIEETELQILSVVLNTVAGALENKYLIDELQAQNRMLEQHVQDRTRDLQDALTTAADANRSKSAFLANMSHELRTPLNAILGYSELIIEDVGEMPDDEIRREAKNINIAGAHLLALINDILDLSKIEAGKMVLDTDAFVLQDLIDGLESTIKPAADKNHNRLVVRNDCSDTVIVQDKVRLQQVLLNLLSNACKFTENGTVTLRLWQNETAKEPRLHATVTDSGIGIAEDSLAELFDPFVQVGEHTHQRFGGTGLGLSICRNICLLMEGAITVDSEPGKGTEFHIEVPWWTETVR